MKFTKLKVFSIPSILLLCSCSNGSDTAQVPEMAPVALQASKKIERLEAPPSQVLLNSKELFASKKSEGLDFADDPILQSQDSFEDLNHDGILELEQTDFSQDLVP